MEITTSVQGMEWLRSLESARTKLVGCKLIMKYVFGLLMICKYIIGFRWSEEKFASSEPLANIVQAILEQVHTFEEELKKRTSDYAQRKQVSTL